MLLYLASTGRRIYRANIDATSTTTFDIHYSANSPHAVASFNATVSDSAGNQVPITHARFKVW